VEHLEILTPPAVTQTGTLTAGAATVSGLATGTLEGAVKVTGTGIAPLTYVESIDSATGLTLTRPATASGPQALTFAIEPIGLADAKLHLRLEIPDDDALVARLLVAARLRASALLRQTLLVTSYQWFLDSFPAAGGGYFNRFIRQQGLNPQWLPNSSAIMYVPNPPLISVESVQFVDSNGQLGTVNPDNYVVSAGYSSRIQPLPGCIWPVGRPQLDGVQVTYTAGVATADLVADNVKVAMLLMLAHWYEHREEVSDFQIFPVPQAVDALLAATDHGSYV
jgi:hypothetical protein